MSSLLLWSVTSAFFAIGLAGIFFPILPGIILVFAGILFYAFATNYASISPVAVGIFGLLAALAWGAQYAGAAAAVRVGGGGVWTVVGTTLGSVLGLVAGGPWGLFAGSFIGALCGALWEGHTSHGAARVALLSVVGVLGAVVVQFVLGISMIVAFLVTVAT